MKLYSRAGSAVHARDSAVAEHAAAVAAHPAGLALARVRRHRVGVTSGGDLVAQAIHRAGLLEAVVNCEQMRGGCK